MKHELGLHQPDFVTADWPGKFEVFSWLEYVVTIPNVISLITTLKENGQPNACLHSWSLLFGDRDHYSCLLAMLDGHHTIANIERTGEWVSNYPSFEHYPRCFDTIKHNNDECDEITESGFTLEPALVLQTPRIAECFASLECRLEWSRPAGEGSRWRVFLGKVVHVALDDSVMVADPAERIRQMNLMYNVRGTIHPLTGDFFGPNTLGLLTKVVLPEIDPETKKEA